MKKYLSVILALCMLLTGGSLMIPQEAMAAVAKPKATAISSIKSEANGFTVNWSKVAETTGYQIQYSTRSDFNGAATVYGGATNTTSKTITGRAAGTKYYIRVRTYKNVNGAYTWGNWSSAKAVTTPAKPKATVISSVSGVSCGFTVKWNKVAETTGYQIQYSTRSDFKGAATVYGGATNTTSKTITGRAANTKYYVRVRTYKNISNNYVWGSWSSAKAVTTKNVPAPKATAISSVSGVSCGFTVKWNKVAETTGYQIQYSTRSDFKGAATVYGGATNTTSKTITGRAANTKYYVRVRTYKTLADGSHVWGSWSPAKAVTTLKKPAEAHCTNNNNHSVVCGNMGKWFNSKSEVQSYVSSVVQIWNQKCDNEEITWEEYIEKCPYGYECWSCGNCGKWTGNFKYH